jgi:hypothetical protein
MESVISTSKWAVGSNTTLLKRALFTRSKLKKRCATLCRHFEMRGINPSSNSCHQVRLMNNLLKKVLAILIVAAVAAPAVSFASTHHHHKYTKAKQVKHTAH